jgi:hypothetical protein
MDFGLIGQLFTAGLNLWNSHEKTKYVDEKMAIEKDFYDEWNKPLDQRSDAVLDRLKFRMRVLATAFAAAAAGPRAPDSSP